MYSISLLILFATTSLTGAVTHLLQLEDALKTLIKNPRVDPALRNEVRAIGQKLYPVHHKGLRARQLTALLQALWVKEEAAIIAKSVDVIEWDQQAKTAAEQEVRSALIAPGGRGEDLQALLIEWHVCNLLMKQDMSEKGIKGAYNQLLKQFPNGMLSVQLSLLSSAIRQEIDAIVHSLVNYWHIKLLERRLSQLSGASGSSDEIKKIRTTITEMRKARERVVIQPFAATTGPRKILSELVTTWEPVAVHTIPLAYMDELAAYDFIAISNNGELYFIKDELGNNSLKYFNIETSKISQELLSEREQLLSSSYPQKKNNNLPMHAFITKIQDDTTRNHSYALRTYADLSNRREIPFSILTWANTYCISADQKMFLCDILAQKALEQCIFYQPSGAVLEWKRKYGQNSWIYAGAFNHDGSLLIVVEINTAAARSDNHEINLYKKEGEHFVLVSTIAEKLSIQDNRVTIALSADGRSAAIKMKNKHNYTLQFWDIDETFAQADEVVSLIPVDIETSYFVLEPEGNYLIDMCKIHRSSWFMSLDDADTFSALKIPIIFKNGIKKSISIQQAKNKRVIKIEVSPNARLIAVYFESKDIIIWSMVPKRLF